MDEESAANANVVVNGERVEQTLDPRLERLLDLALEVEAQCRSGCGKRARRLRSDPVKGHDRRRPAIAQAALGAALALGLACGAPDPEEQLENASERVAEAERGVEAARRVVEREEADLEQAQSELADATEALGEAEGRLAEAKRELAEVADDAYLFRAVQSALLADPALEDLAIAARVRDRVVTLEGSAPSLELRKKAGAVAEATLGVERVQNDVTVQPPPET